jgi:mono/diheme cytochrome c family protein
MRRGSAGILVSVAPRPHHGWPGLRGLAAAGALLLLLGAAAHAENLDAGKSGARLFADSCSTCHRSARGLAKGRFRLTLYLFLQQHYSSGSDSASALASYLQSVDTPQAAPSRAGKRAHPAFHPPRPPMPVPNR